MQTTDIGYISGSVCGYLSAGLTSCLLPPCPQLIDYWNPLCSEAICWWLRGAMVSWQTECVRAKLSSFFFIPWQTFAKWEIEYISAEGTHLRLLHFADAARVFEWTWLFAVVVHKRGLIMWCSKTRLIHFPCGILICVCGCHLSGRTATFRCFFFFFTWEEGLPSISTHSWH